LQPEDSTAARVRIGYFVPEFPAQTHIFFWREVNALRELGTDVVLISTRKPAEKTIAHAWSTQAMSSTQYLLDSGPIDWLTAIARLLRNVLSRQPSLVAALLDDEYRSLGNRLKLWLSAVVGARLASFAQTSRLTHIHVGSCGRSAEIAAIGSVVGNFTYSLSMLGPSFSTYGDQHRLKWRHATFALFQSNSLLQEGRNKLGPDLPPLHAVAPVGVDTDRMVRTVPYRAWQSGTPCLLYSCGRLNPVKGHEDVIDAVCMLRDRGIDARLTIGGEDEQGGSGYRKVVEAHVARRKASAFVTLLGAVSEDRNKIEYERAHVYVMGSHDEAAGAVAAMEAMAMQTPVVMCRAGATAELINDGQDGILTDPRSPPQLADAVERILQNPNLAEALREAGRRVIVSRYSHRISAEAICNMLRSIQAEPADSRETEKEL
jgi:glycosyltransferase involved in cell wall biosynthesis